MNSEDVRAIQKSFDLIEPIAETAASLFYARLFELNPTLRPMFQADLKLHGEKLMTALKLVVIGLDSPEIIIPAVESLGRRHVEYGVQVQHFETFGEALIWTMEKGLGDAYTLEIENAWRNLFAFLRGLMMEVTAEKTI